MNFWAFLAPLLAQTVSQVGPVAIAELEAALNQALSPHGHTAVITPVAPANPVPPPAVHP